MASTSKQIEKPEIFTVHEHVAYRSQTSQAQSNPTPSYDQDSTDVYSVSWHTAWRAICQLYNTINHMIIAIVVFSIWRFALTSEANGTVSKYELHIVFAGTGYQLFLVEAILTLSGHNSWSSQLSRDSKRVIHGCLQLIGGAFVLAGTSMILAQLDVHFTSGHGICGFIALIFTLLSMFSGIITLFSAKVRLMFKHGPMKILHVGIATSAVSMGLVSLALGYNTEHFKVGAEEFSICMIVLTSLTLVYVIIPPIKNLIRSVQQLL